MLLEGKEIQALLGAIMVFQHIPLNVNKRKMSQSEENCLEELFDKLMTATEKEFKKVDAENYVDSNTIKRRLSISINYSFSSSEIDLIKESFEIYIAEAKERNDAKSLNVYHGGDMYDLDMVDFKSLLGRFKGWV